LPLAVFFAAGFFSSVFSAFLGAAFFTSAASFLAFVFLTATSSATGSLTAFSGAFLTGDLTPLMLIISISEKFWRCPFLTLYPFFLFFLKTITLSPLI